ncbi:MAG: FAD-dependent monooxygenase [Gammaproteobacteria bacterium]|nr:FAD-dependent monooxygenase [Gammaproteobacteria bacterium]
MNNQVFDVIVVGAALAGTTAATLFARAGLRVALVERNPDSYAYKQLCTHFIQGSATPTLARLGVLEQLEARGGLRNSANIWTRWGWIFEPEMHDANGASQHGFNLRRQVLDPLLCQTAAATPGVELCLGHSVKDLIVENGRVTGIVTHAAAGDRTLRSRLVVAADGRNSRLAELAKIRIKSSPNRRSLIMAQYREVPLVHGATSQMWIDGAKVGYIFPNDDGVTVVAAMPPQADFANFKADPAGHFERYMQAFPDSPDLQKAVRISEFIQVKDYPNQTRAPVALGMALIGDAALSMDPLFGVGCGWALQSAEWLVDVTAPALKAGTGVEAALRDYAKVHQQKLGGHAFIVADFSKRYAFNLIERLMFKAATRDVAAARHLFLFAKRISSLAEFLNPRIIARALWLTLQPAKPNT